MPNQESLESVLQRIIKQITNITTIRNDPAPLHDFIFAIASRPA
jgi:hypothetical protein